MNTFHVSHGHGHGHGHGRGRTNYATYASLDASTVNDLIVALSLSALFLHCLDGALRQIMKILFLYAVADTSV